MSRRYRSARCCGCKRATALMLGLALMLAPHSRPGAAPSPATSATSAEHALERRVKAAFLFRFSEFVTWPESAFPQPDTPFTVAVAGRDAFVDELRQITAGRSVGTRRVEVRRVSEGESMPPAHIVLIPDTERPRLREWIRIAPRHALIVTESEGALNGGSVINFVLVEGRVRFEIALDSAEKRGLRMSSRLLALALGVRGGNP